MNARNFGCAQIRAMVYAIALIVALPSDGSAQAPPSPESSVEALEAGQRVRIQAADALNVEGVFLGLEGQDMLLRTAEAEQTQRVPVDRLEALWVRERNTRKGALIGGITGAVLGLGVGAYGRAYVLDPGVFDAGDLAAITVVGAGLGAALGALIGYLVPGWSPVWP